MSWSREQCELLIDEYQKYPCLYAVKSNLYKNKHARNKALESITSILKSIKPNVTLNEIKQKLAGLKSTFLAEHKKSLNSKVSGVGEDQIYTPSIWYYKRMMFLLEHFEIPTTIDTLTQAHDRSEMAIETPCLLVNQDIEYTAIDNVLDSTSSEEIPTTSTSQFIKNRYEPKLKRKRTVDDQQLLKGATDALATISSSFNTQIKNIASEQENKNDENDTFARFIVSKLNLITDPTIRFEVEKEIISKIYNGISRSVVSKNNIIN
ncbi:hypothetical protein ABEB36_009210 [Hypothenemus hampei]|uniref:MADF domain-containing protein n=1 Tax=Hypothenemus hampei TaxID=57062 RepID=A0ABD1EPJ2_HYPHA